MLGYFPDSYLDDKTCKCGKPATGVCNNIPWFVCGHEVCDECACPCCHDRSGVISRPSQPIENS